jgi:hypothetical protein
VAAGPTPFPAVDRKHLPVSDREKRSNGRSGAVGGRAREREAAGARTEVDPEVSDRGQAAGVISARDDPQISHFDVFDDASRLSSYGDGTGAFADSRRDMDDKRMASSRLA